MTTTRHQFILATIVEAGDLLIKTRDDKFTVSFKNGDTTDLVTSVDIVVDEFIKKAIKATFPDDLIYSEESAKDDLASGSSCWTIDPIDGTANFSRGIPHYAVSLGYIENGICIVGAIYNPITRELFSFEKGKGAYLNGKLIHVSKVETISEAYILLLIGRSKSLHEWGLGLQRRFLGSAKKISNLGSSALDLCFVASGRVDAMIYGLLTTKDISPAIGILREAGGEVYGENGDQVVLSDKPQKVFATATRGLFEEVKDSGK
ncbi:MAG: inositol monophosphatase [Candidatus Pacebacteria bacterium]|nr:inositol monophosphatase [Candidatus Paceibacterota bacterium]